MAIEVFSQDRAQLKTELQIKLTSTYPSGKRVGHAVNAASGVPCLYAAFVINSTQPSRRFLVDTGAAVSIIPTESAKFAVIYPSSIHLRAATGQPIKIAGECQIEISSPSLRRSFKWVFTVADVSEPILGMDFLTHYGLIVDCKNATILDSKTSIILKCQRSFNSNVRPVLCDPTSHPDVN